MSLHSITGYYSVGPEIHVHKLTALLRASALNVPAQWHYHDDVFSTAPKNYDNMEIDVRQLYKHRAEQLRQTYDYLILNYSGGIDSWTILHTFLSNKIKLDKIVVKWPMKAMDKGWYTPNQIDKTAYNSVSEWDFVLKHDLAWLNAEHPEIEIEIVDWLDNLDKERVNDTSFETNNIHRFYYSNMIRIPKLSSTILHPGNKKVASILGIDKPQIVEKGNRCYFYFSDAQFLTQEPTMDPSINIENFYWTASFPALPIKQAFKVFQWYKQNPAFRDTIKAPSEQKSISTWDLPQWYKNMEDKTSITKMVIYPDWDFNRFQAFKPIPMTVELEKSTSPKDVWMEKFLPINNLKQEWAHHWKSYAKELSPAYTIPGTNQMRSLDSKWHYLGDF